MWQFVLLLRGVEVQHSVMAVQAYVQTEQGLTLARPFLPSTVTRGLFFVVQPAPMQRRIGAGAGRHRNNVRVVK